MPCLRCTAMTSDLPPSCLQTSTDVHRAAVSQQYCQKLHQKVHSTRHTRSSVTAALQSVRLACLFCMPDAHPNDLGALQSSSHSTCNLHQVCSTSSGRFPILSRPHRCGRDTAHGSSCSLMTHLDQHVPPSVPQYCVCQPPMLDCLM